MMYPKSELDNYKLQVELLQEKLNRSEDNRRQLENKLDRIKQKHLCHEKAFKSKARQKYQEFLNEQKKRNERNKMLVEMLERVDSQSAALAARSEHLKMMKMQYEMYFAKLVQSQTMQCLQSVARPIPTTIPTTTVPTTTTTILLQPSELRQPPPSGTLVINQDIDKGIEDSRAKFNDAAISNSFTYVASRDGIQSPTIPSTIPADMYQRQRQWRLAMTPSGTRMPTEMLLTNLECMKYPDEYVRSSMLSHPDSSNLSKVRFQQQFDLEKPQVYCDNVDAYPMLLPNNGKVDQRHRFDDCGLEVTPDEAKRTREDSTIPRESDSMPPGFVKTPPIPNDDNASKKKCPIIKASSRKENEYDTGVPFKILQPNSDSAAREKLPRSSLDSQRPLHDEKQKLCNTSDRYPALLPETRTSDDPRFDEKNISGIDIEDLHQLTLAQIDDSHNSNDDSEIEESRDNRSVSVRNNDDGDNNENDSPFALQSEIEKGIDPNNVNGGMVGATNRTEQPTLSHSSTTSADYRPVKFTKKKKMSIENIENVIYGELVQSMEVEPPRKEIDSGDPKALIEGDTRQQQPEPSQEENESHSVSDSPGVANQLTNPSSTMSTVDYEATQIYTHPTEQQQEPKTEQYVVDESSTLTDNTPDGQDYQYAAAVEGQDYDNIDYQNYDPPQNQNEYDAYSYAEYDEKNDNVYVEANQILNAPGQDQDLQQNNNVEGVEQEDMQKFTTPAKAVSVEGTPVKTSTLITKDLQKSEKLSKTTVDEPPMVKEQSKSATLISKDLQKTVSVEEAPHIKEETKVSKAPATPIISKVSKIKSSPSVVKQIKGKPSSIRPADKTLSAEKKKKRVNFVNKETDESSVKADTVVAGGGSSESDFDFSLSENK